MAKLPGVPVLKFRKALIDAGYKRIDAKVVMKFGRRLL